MTLSLGLMLTDLLVRRHGHSLNSMRQLVDHDADEAMKILIASEALLPSEKQALISEARLARTAQAPRQQSRRECSPPCAQDEHEQSDDGKYTE